MDLPKVLSTAMAGQLDVFQHDGNTFGMDSTQVCILQEAGQVIFGCLLQHHDCTHLEAQVIPFTCLCYLMDQACKRSLPNEELGALLVFPNHTESHCPWPVPLGFFNTPLVNSLQGAFPIYGGPVMAGLLLSL